MNLIQESFFFFLHVWCFFYPMKGCEIDILSADRWAVADEGARPSVFR